MPVVLDLFVLVVAWVHVLLAPYTKVEESFNLHATHDVLMYGVGPSVLPKYDHVTFPGAVPRTFVGSILLAWISTPFIIWWNTLGFASTKFDLQIASMCAALDCEMTGPLFFSQTYIGDAQCRRSLLRQAYGPKKIWPSHGCFLCAADVFTIPSALLDWPNAAKYVRSATWSVSILLLQCFLF